jgi:hypothetical protein
MNGLNNLKRTNNMENKRIPFDWEKYQSGEYTPICRNGDIPEMITYNPNAKEVAKIAMWVNGHVYSLNGNGKVRNEFEFPLDIFLIPKPKRFQAWVNCYDTGAAISWSNEDIAKQYEQMNNGFVKTILIEWEG